MRGLTGKDAGREETGAQEAQMQEGLSAEYIGKRTAKGKAASDRQGDSAEDPCERSAVTWLAAAKEKQNQRRHRSTGESRTHKQNRQPIGRVTLPAFSGASDREGAAVETVLVSGAAGSGGRDASDDSCGGDSVAAVPTVVVSAAAVVSSGAAPSGVRRILAVICRRHSDR